MAKSALKEELLPTDLKEVINDMTDSDGFKTITIEFPKDGTKPMVEFSGLFSGVEIASAQRELVLQHRRYKNAFIRTKLETIREMSKNDITDMKGE